MPSLAVFVPSRRTVVQLAVGSLLGTLLYYWYLRRRLLCPGQSLSCTENLELIAISTGYGASLGAAFTSFVLFLNLTLPHAQRERSCTEPPHKVLPVAIALFMLQSALTGAIALAGALHESWPWWLGAFGAFFT
jgi:hypothetical protein